MNVPPDQARIERLISLSLRLVEALEADIVALKRGRPAEMKSVTVESRRLSALYSREAQNFDIRLATAAPASLRARFISSTAKFRDVLKLHARMLVRVKNASEGMILAIAREVERANQITRPYGPQPARRSQPSGAMVVNRVV
ncbi:MAG: hypothetical protein ACREFW_06780 [Rhizomicrobium sp.]